MKPYLPSAAFAAVLFAAPILAHADCAIVNGRAACTGHIEQLFLHNSGQLYIGMDGDETKLGCQPTEPTLVAIPTSHPLFASYLSMLLAAQLSGKTITLRFDATTGPCTVGYLRLYTTPPP
jgi:hypothetical protein